MAIWDEYQQQQQQGWTPPPGIEGSKAPPVVTSGNSQWQANQPGAPQPQPTPIPPIPSAPQSTPRPYTLPAVDQMLNPRNTAFARNAPVNTPAMNGLNQVPIGGHALGSLLGVGYSRSPNMNPSDFMNQGVGQNQQPTMTGYKWNAGTGGLQGGNNDWTRQFYSDGSMRSFTGGVEDNQPLALTIWTQPGANAPGESGPYADVRALSDHSVGALDDATRTKNQYGQKVITTPTGSQMISGPAGSPSFGSLQGSTTSTNAKGQTVLNTPSGGQAIAGKSLRKPQKMTTGQNWSLGGWY